MSRQSKRYLLSQSCTVYLSTQIQSKCACVKFSPLFISIACTWRTMDKLFSSLCMFYFCLHSSGTLYSYLSSLGDKWIVINNLSWFQGTFCTLQTLSFHLLLIQAHSTVSREQSRSTLHLLAAPSTVGWKYTRLGLCRKLRCILWIKEPIDDCLDKESMWSRSWL